MRFIWRRPGDKARTGDAVEREAPLLEAGSPPLSNPSTSTLKAYARMPLRDDMFNPNQVAPPQQCTRRQGTVTQAAKFVGGASMQRSNTRI